MTNPDFRTKKLQRLLEVWYGLEGVRLDEEDPLVAALGAVPRLANLLLDTLVPGICMNEGCDEVVEVEPDCGDGFCEVCETASVASVCVLADFTAEHVPGDDGNE